MTFEWKLVTKHVRATPLLQEKVRQKVQKLETHLLHFPPDAVHLQIVLQKYGKMGQYMAVLTLHLPSNVLHTEKPGPDLVTAFDLAFKALLREIQSLKAELRGEDKWKRKDRRTRLQATRPLRLAELPLPSRHSAGMMEDAVADVLRREQARLRHYVARQLARHRFEGDVPRDAIEARDVVDEVVRQVESDHELRPPEMSWRVWFYHLARAELRRRVQELQADARNNVPVDEPGIFAEEFDQDRDDETGQPVEAVERQMRRRSQLREVLADTHNAPPDEAAAEHELVEYLHEQAAAWPAKERTVFDLHFLEGFEDDEVGMLENMSLDQVRDTIRRLQERLRGLLREATEAVAARPRPQRNAARR